jgi:predicted dehydrogenase
MLVERRMGAAPRLQTTASADIPLGRMNNVRIGVVGLGSMGNFHVGYLHEIEGAQLTAICDADPNKPGKVAAGLVDVRARADQRLAHRVADPQAVGKFTTYEQLLDSKLVDAIIIATPHFQHPEIALAAFERNIHVLSEKPLAVHVKDARKVIDAHKQKPNLTFGLVMQLRTVGLYKKIKEMITSGELGDISRATWIVTDWFRTWSYYASGGWRATWKGEGGGVLINQCPHNLDMLQWLMGAQPSRVTAVAALGKTHPIEVEDEVSAILEYPSGAIAHFMTTTGEAPGTNRLEIVGDRGKLIAEGGKLTFHRTRKSVRDVREHSPDAFVNMETWASEIPLLPGVLNDGHRTITQNFVNNILKNEPLIAPGEEGSKGLEIGNAMLMSGVTRKPVDLPLDGDAYEQLLKDLDKQYGGKKTLQTRVVNADMATSFQRP